MAKASIAIFPRKIGYEDQTTRPETPKEVFEAARKIIAAKSGCELVRSKIGLYIVMYSETGPSSTPQGWEGWLPIYVARIEKWASGGIKGSEMEKFLTSKENENESSDDS